MPVPTVTITEPSGSLVLSLWVGTEYVVDVEPELITTVFAPSFPDAT